MAVRFLPDGSYEFLDPIGVGSTAGGGPVYDDGTRNAPWQRQPFMGLHEVRASQSTELMAIPAEQLARVRPPVPQQLFPQRLGYVGQPLTINDIFEQSVWTPKIRSWISGPPRQLIRTDDGDMQDGAIRPGLVEG